ncbi:hypothetical protein [Yinghuangia sp. YIM S09857]|uniref:hypothetical protein n=1 Tax=Yinghuangia sp. YIM S09857 TaxID=3436929 RepID=UPI003F52A52A
MTTPLGSDHRIETTPPESPSQASGTFGGRLKTRLRAVRPADLVVMAIPTVILAVMGWQKRWMTDDGLIFTRAVRQILEGNGPVYNIGERTETSTSTAWQWLLVAFDWISPWQLAVTAVYLGLALSVAGMWLALDGTRRLYRGTTSARFLLPAGALVFVAVPSVWDFTTAGMETGLIIFWVGSSWSLLTSVWQREPEDTSLRRLLLTSAYVGLGPLVRPDLGLTMLIFLVSLALLTRANWKRCAGMLVAAGILPVAYEIFRMGYYGLLFPMPALTKEASESPWDRGWIYLKDYVKPYDLWIPALLLVALIVILVLRIRPARRTLIVALTPLVCAAFQGLYVIKVGGDFMHGRMWMPVMLLAVLPLALTPFTRLTTPVVAALCAWAVFTGGFQRTGYVTSPHVQGIFLPQVWNERDMYLRWTESEHPVSQQPHVRTLQKTYSQIVHALKDGERIMVFDPNFGFFSRMAPDGLTLRKDLDYPVGLVIGRLGVGGAVVPIDGIVVDVWGLSNPIGSHIEQTHPSPSGHQKLLPVAWAVAMYVDPASFKDIPPGVAPQDQIAAAKHTLECGDVKELMDSVTEPMSFERFWKNLTGAYDRTTLRIPADPIEAEKKFCK